MAFTEKHLLPGEELLRSRLANLWITPSEYGLSEFAFGGSEGAESIGGRAHLTNFRVVFAAHAFNRLTGSHSVFLPNIEAVRKGWTSLTVTTRTQTYQFVMWFNRGFYTAVEEARAALGRKELRQLQSLVRDNLGKVSKGLRVNAVAEIVNGAFLGVLEPLTALKGVLTSMPPEDQSAVLEVVTLLEQGAGGRRRPRG